MRPRETPLSSLRQNSKTAGSATAALIASFIAGQKTSEPKFDPPARQTVPPQTQLERYPHTQLNLSRVERIESAGNFAESAIRHVRIDSTQVAMIENVEKVKTELQVALLPEPGQFVVL